MRVDCTGSIRRRKSSSTASLRSSGPTGGRTKRKSRRHLLPKLLSRVGKPSQRIGTLLMTTITRRIAVFDSDSHIVEPPELWEKYLDPEFRVLGKQALWRHDGETNSYLKINGEVVRDTMNSNLPRHAIWRPGMSWDSVGELDASVRHSMNEGAWNARARLADMDAMGIDQAFLYPTWFAEGFHLVADPDTAYALARAYNDWIPGLCRRHAAAAGHGLHARGTAPRRRHPVLPRRIHPSHVLPGPLLHQPVF